MAVKVAINGFGRIGRLVLRAIVESGYLVALAVYAGVSFFVVQHVNHRIGTELTER